QRVVVVRVLTELSIRAEREMPLPVVGVVLNLPRLHLALVRVPVDLQLNQLEPAVMHWHGSLTSPLRSAVGKRVARYRPRGTRSARPPMARPAPPPTASLAPPP